jgi:redox-sensing transcriptional repressor
VPDDVEVRKVDLAVEMQILSFHVARRADEAAEDAAAAAGATPDGALPTQAARRSGGAHRADRVTDHARNGTNGTVDGTAGGPGDGSDATGVNGMVIRR